MPKKAKRKPTTTSTTFRMPIDLMKQLQIKAAKIGISRTKLMQLVLAREVEDMDIKAYRDLAVSTAAPEEQNDFFD